jgi:hypothetical protein
MFGRAQALGKAESARKSRIFRLLQKWQTPNGVFSF